MTFNVSTPDAKFRSCFLEVYEYDCGNIFVGLANAHGDICDVTVYVPGIEAHPKDCSCVDTQNYPWLTTMIQKLGIGHPTGNIILSGLSCVYPVYKFDMEKIKEYVRCN